MKYLMSADWWRAASIRAAKTMFQTGAALVVTQMPSGTVDWMAVGSAAIVAGVASSVPVWPVCRSWRKNKRQKEKETRRIRLFQGVVRRRPPQFIAILYHKKRNYAENLTNWK